MDEQDFPFALVNLPCTHKWKGEVPCPFCSGEIGTVEIIPDDEEEVKGVGE